MKAVPKRPFRGLAALVLCLLVVAGSGVGGYLYSAAEKRSTDTEARARLAAVADMKVQQLVAWRTERLADAKSLQFNPLVVPALLQSLNSGSDRGEIKTWLEQLLEAYQFTAASLWDKDYRRRAWLPAGDAGHEWERELIAQAMRTRTPFLADLHRDDPTGAPYMTLVAPLQSSSSFEPVATLLLKIDPERFLYPFIQAWPTPSGSAETLLVRREGEEGVYLNELRHRKHTALTVRFPLSRGGLPSVKAILGFEGVANGTDYRGIPVLAAIKHVPDSPWYLVAKVDTREVFARLRREMVLIATSFALLAAALVAGIMFVWSKQETRAAQQHFEAELERRAMLGHFDYLSRYANDIILLPDATGRILEANDRAVDSYGYDADELRRMNVADLHVPEEAAALARTWIKVKERAAEGLVFETEHVRKDGSRFPVEISARSFAIEGREFRQEIVRDITERKRAEEKLRRYSAELLVTNEDLKRFTQLVLHDLRTPLVNLQGFSTELHQSIDTLRKSEDALLANLAEPERAAVAEALQETIPEALSFIEGSVTRMDHLTGALLSLSRASRRDLRMEELDAGALVQEAVESLAHEIQGHDIAFEIGPLPRIASDRAAIKQIFGNLLDNAVKYLDPERPGHIEVSAEETAETVTFHMRDNGRGIAADDMDKAFAPFRRAGAQDVPGEGMGLAYVRMLLYRLGGRIECQSQPGVGTTFSFTLPKSLLRNTGARSCSGVLGLEPRAESMT